MASDLADLPPLPSRFSPQRWLRRAGASVRNALELTRLGLATARRDTSYEVVHRGQHYRLRRYAAAARQAEVPVLLLVPPLMLTAEIYDVAEELSAVALLGSAGIEPWVVDFGAPEHEAGGMTRTLADHVLAVVEAVGVVARVTGRPVHLAGYSQGGMFCYQAAAFAPQAPIASLVTFGSPVDIHSNLPAVSADLTGRLIRASRPLVEPSLRLFDGVSARVASASFRVYGLRSEIGQIVEFSRLLHDRRALAKHRARRRFLGGEGFVAWPGPALLDFIEDFVVHNRMLSGGFVLEGRTVTLADIRCPILYFVGTRDDIARPPAVRAVRRAVPAAAIYEARVPSGHFGLVVGSTALHESWPTVIAWLRWRQGLGPLPESCEAVARDGGRPLGPSRAPAGSGERREVAAAAGGAGAGQRRTESHAGSAGKRASRKRAAGRSEAGLRGSSEPGLRGSSEPGLRGSTEPGQRGSRESGLRAGLGRDVGLVYDTARGATRVAWKALGHRAEDLGDALDHARYQLPHLLRLRRLHDEVRVSSALMLERQARRIGEQPFFLYRGRAVSFGAANTRVDNVVRGLIQCGIRPGDLVGVLMHGRPSFLSISAALNRLGAVALVLRPETDPQTLRQALGTSRLVALVADPEHAAAALEASDAPVLVLGGGPSRPVPAGVTDMEAIDPSKVPWPSWYRPNPGRAGDTSSLLVTLGPGGRRVARISNRRWAFSAHGAAAATGLTPRDTVYCALPLHHPAGLLVSVGSALVGGVRLALASDAKHGTFWDEVRRYGATVCYYAGELCRPLVDAPVERGERAHPLRVFAGSGMRRDVWSRLRERFDVEVIEFYASTEVSLVLANATGKLGSVGRPLPGSREPMLAAYDLEARDFRRDARGRVVPAGVGVVGVLLGRVDPMALSPLDERSAREPAAHPRRVLRDVAGPGDAWFVTGDLLSRDAQGDYFLIDRLEDVLATEHGAIPSRPIEDLLYGLPELQLCAVFGVPAGIVGARPASTRSASPPSVGALPAIAPSGSALSVEPSSLAPSPATPSAPAAAAEGTRLQQIVAAVVLRPGAVLEARRLSEAFRGHLSPASWPALVQVVPDLPLNDGHRVLKAALRATGVAEGGERWVRDGDEYRRVEEAPPRG